MKVVANSIPKSGTHLLDRLLMLLGLDLVDLGGVGPRLAEGARFAGVRRRLGATLGLRGSENVMGVGSHLVSGGRFPLSRRLLRTRGETVTVGVDFPEELHAVAISVCMILGRPIQRELLLARILNRFEELLESDLHETASLWVKTCYHLDRTVRFHSPQGLIEGRFTGVNAVGQGLIEMEGDVRAFTAGELDLIPDETQTT